MFGIYLYWIVDVVVFYCEVSGMCVVYMVDDFE